MSTAYDEAIIIFRSEIMLVIISTCCHGLPEDIDDLIYGDAGTVPSERIAHFKACLSGVHIAGSGRRRF